MQTRFYVEGREVTTDDKLASVEREIRMRRRVYGRQVAANRMTQREADREIVIFEAIADDYRQQAQGERLL